MDVDEGEDGTQRPKQVLDYGIQVDFESNDEDNLEDPCEAARFDEEITEKTAEIGRMAPSIMKTMERSVMFYRYRSIGSPGIQQTLFRRLNDVER